MDGPTASSVEVGRASTPHAESPLAVRLLGVVAAAVLGIGTFATLGLALAQLLYERGVIGDVGHEEMEELSLVIGGVIAGAAVGTVVSVWVGLRVWQGRWALLVVLVGVTLVTAATLAITAL